MARRKEDADGAAFRLLVSRALTVMVDPESMRVAAIGWGGITREEPFTDKADATIAARRAVVAAAAEVDRRYRTPGVPVTPNDQPKEPK